MEVLPYSGATGIRIALQPLQVGPHVGGMLVSHISILLQRLVDDVFQLGRKVWIQLERRSRTLSQKHREDYCRRIAHERLPSRCHLIQDSTERK